MKILVIEDEPQLLSNVKESLEKEKFLVETASDYHEAIDKLFIYEYDCILLDIMLPNGNGLQILSQLKAEEKSEKARSCFILLDLDIFKKRPQAGLVHFGDSSQVKGHSSQKKPPFGFDGQQP